MDVISSWDKNFLKVDQGTLFSLIKAANYLKIDKLLELGCQTVANMIGGKTPDEIRVMFRCFDVTDEEDQTRRENEWIDE